MKLKLSPTEIFEAYEALDEQGKMEFMMKLMGHLHDTMGFPMPDGMGDEDDNDEWGNNPLDPEEDLLPSMGLTSIVCHPERPSRQLTVRVELKGIKPPIWRKLVIPSNLILESFAHIILLSMGWDMEHLHQFVKGTTFYSVPTSDDGFDMFSMMENKDSRNYTIGDLIFNIGDKCTFEYDFGDGWEHLITVQESRDYEEGENRNLVTLIGGKRACPPEDIGGVPGYMDFCEAIKKPRSKRAKELIEWYGDYDPEEFDLEMYQYDIEDIDGNGEEMIYE